MPFGASWQPPRKMSKKSLESVLVLGLALEKCPENARKVSKNISPDIFQTLFLHFLANREPKGGARPLLGGGRRPPPLYWPKNVKKCLENVWGHFWDIFLTFSGHFSSASPSTRTFSRHFLDIFLGGCQEAPKGTLGHFFDIFRGQAQDGQKRFLDIFWPF